MQNDETSLIPKFCFFLCHLCVTWLGQLFSGHKERAWLPELFIFHYNRVINELCGDLAIKRHFEIKEC